MKVHSPPRSQSALAAFIAAAAFLFAHPAEAVRLGELTVHSALGEALDASIALKPGADEVLAPECFRLGSSRATPLLLDSRTTFAIDSTGAIPKLRLRTAAPIREPALQLRISAACPGGRATTRDYEVLLDPRLAIARAVAEAPAATVATVSPAETPAVPLAEKPAPTRAPATETRQGDTLASIATAIYPKNPAARDAYVQALRRDNTSLSALGADEPIPAGTVFVLPDLREFSRSLPRTTAAKSPRKAAPLAEKPPALAPMPAPKVEHRPPAQVAQPATGVTPGSPFMLRLSSPTLDLGRSKGIDERQRAQLRERQLALDADDKVAALLAMKHNIRQLEGRVAELQLKLSSLSVPPAPKVAEPAKPATPATVAPKVVEPAKPAEPSPPPPKAAVPASPPPPPAKATTPDSPPPPPVPQKTPEKAAAIPTKAPAPPAAAGMLEDVPPWLWGLLAAFVALVAVLGGLWLRRRSAPAQPAAPLSETPAPVSALDEAEALMRGDDRVEPVLSHGDEGRAVAESDAGLVTRVGGADPAALRRRYIEERFPEIAGGTIVLDDADSIVKAARLFYEDGALPRAVELLQFAVEEKPAVMKPWLALFEIFRLEGLAGEFGSLAGRFREHHGASENWRKVQFIGRELDAQNPLYHDAPQAHLETIGPIAAARSAPVTFDPLAENWLNAPMDFTSEALASTLRAALLSDAGVQETDLVLDAMPALKNVEMFNVA